MHILQPPVALQGAKDEPVDRVEVGWHRMLILAANRQMRARIFVRGGI
jgi:hypothetical protein